MKGFPHVHRKGDGEDRISLEAGKRDGIANKYISCTFTGQEFLSPSLIRHEHPQMDDEV